jgi:hypothetical protein
MLLLSHLLAGFRTTGDVFIHPRSYKLVQPEGSQGDVYGLTRDMGRVGTDIRKSINKVNSDNHGETYPTAS